MNVVFAFHIVVVTYSVIMFDLGTKGSRKNYPEVADCADPQTATQCECCVCMCVCVCVCVCVYTFDPLMSNKGTENIHSGPPKTPLTLNS
jgi:hypothetical protein